MWYNMSWLPAFSLIFLSTTAAGAAEPLPAALKAGPPRPVAEAHNEFDVPHLPDRLTGAWQDRWVTMNVHWPKDDRRHACILFVHGGGYGGGDKDTRFCDRAIERAVAGGFTAVSLNYILGRDIFPQVFYDVRTYVLRVERLCAPERSRVLEGGR